ncbi:MAG: cyclase family protein [Actinomycetota bacterium]
MSQVTTGARPVSRAEFDQVFETCKNWGKWGPDDERGALNEIGPEQVRAAASLVRSGRTVSCSWPLDTVAGPDNPKPVLHHMTLMQDIPLGDSGDLRVLLDFFGMEPHGDAHSHIDALGHVVFGGSCYNGMPIEEVADSTGMRKQGMDVARDGLVSRGVLIDVPKLRGTRWVEPGEAIEPDEFLAAEEATGTRLRQGDIVFLRTGHARKRVDEGPWDAASSKAGLHTTVMPILHDRQVAAIGYDGDGEAVPSNCEGVAYPIHAIGIVAMGLYFCDSLYFEDLAAACEEEGRSEFMCVISPLRLARGTGSPVNPTAIF